MLEKGRLLGGVYLLLSKNTLERDREGKTKTVWSQNMLEQRRLLGGVYLLLSKNTLSRDREGKPFVCLSITP